MAVFLAATLIFYRLHSYVCEDSSLMEAKLFKSVNFKDYAIMANRWLEQLLFPFE